MLAEYEAKFPVWSLVCFPSAQSTGFTNPFPGIAGAMENDPIIEEMRKFKSLELSSKIFIVDWNTCKIQVLIDLPVDFFQKS